MAAEQLGAPAQTRSATVAGTSAPAGTTHAGKAAAMAGASRPRRQAGTAKASGVAQGDQGPTAPAQVEHDRIDKVVGAQSERVPAAPTTAPGQVHDARTQ